MTLPKPLDTVGIFDASAKRFRNGEPRRLKELPIKFFINKGRVLDIAFALFSEQNPSIFFWFLVFDQ